VAVVLVVEDGTGLSTANAYVSEADCAAYHIEMGNAEWAASVDVDAKAAAIVQATRYVDHHYRRRFQGYRESSTQALEWPRTEVYDDLGTTISGVPMDVKRATHELALRALAGDLMADEERGGAVKSLSIAGAVSLEYESGAPLGTVYRIVDELLDRVLTQSGGIPLRRV
jgi:hypothetical protein